MKTKNFLSLLLMPLVFAGALSACHLTDSSVAKDDSVCKGSACNSGLNPIQHINTSVHGGKEDVSAHNDGSEYRYWFEASFQSGNSSTYGILDINVTNDIFDGANKLMTIGAPVVSGTGCTNTGTSAALQGLVQVNDLTTGVQVSSTVVTNSVSLSAIALDTYQIHYSYTNLAVVMGNCSSILVRVPVYVSTQ